MDDILTASSTLEKHLVDLRNVLSTLAEHKLRMSLSKCEFLRSELTFLGYEVNSQGIRPPQDHARDTAEFPFPETTTELHRFYGHA